MEKVEVETRTDEAGETTPVRFKWNGRWYTIDSVGRRWQDERGRHVLVMVPGGQTFELLFTITEGRWYLGLIGQHRMMA
jgi:hypothetical protein